jgi:chromosome segregation ATPase
MEQRVKELETKFSKEQKDVIRKNDLNEKIRQLQDEDKKVSIVPRLAMFGERYLLKNIKINLLNFCSSEINLLQLAELRPKQRTKESEKQRQREHASEEEERLSGNISSFTGEVTALKNLQNEIEKSKEALDESNMDTIDDKLKKLEEKKKEKEGSINELQPEIERVIRKINDQESQKKVIQGNIDLYHARQNLQELEKEVKGLQEELKQIEGYDKAIKEWEVAHSKKIELDEEKLRLEGRREGFREQMMLIKVRIQLKICCLHHKAQRMLAISSAS